MLLHIAINRSFVGKMPVDATKSEWSVFNASFRNETIDALQLGDAINAGRAYTTQHVFSRKSCNFLRGQHLALDFDTGDYRSSIPSLLSDEFIAKNALMIHTTQSHTPSKPRARVVFMFGSPIDDMNRYSLYAQAIVHKYGQDVDKKCKDPVRLFFGALGCTVIYLGNTLDDLMFSEIVVSPYIRFVKSRQEMRQVPAMERVHESVIASIVSRQIDKILSAIDGEKYATLLSVGRTLGGYVAAGYIPEADAISQMTQAIMSRDIKSKRVATDAITSSVQFGMTQPLYIQDDFAAMGVMI